MVLDTVWVLSHLQYMLCLYIMTFFGQIQVLLDFSCYYSDIQVYSGLYKSIHAALIVPCCFVGVIVLCQCHGILQVMQLASVLVLLQSSCLACVKLLFLCLLLPSHCVTSLSSLILVCWFHIALLLFCCCLCHVGLVAFCWLPLLFNHTTALDLALSFWFYHYNCALP